MLALDDNFFKFISDHKGDNVAKLRLKFHNSDLPWMDMAITHIECLQKCGRKFGAFQPDLMSSPLAVEQATSERVAMLHGKIASELVGDARLMVDMTCGMGIDLRAVSNSLKCRAIGIEMQSQLAEVTAYNFRNDENVEVINDDSVEWLRCWQGDKIDLIFIDPARRGDKGEKLYNIHDCKPDVGELLPLFEQKCRYVIVKLSPMLDLTQTLRDLPPTSSLYVVDDGGECREVLAILDFTSAVDIPQVIIHAETGEFRFTLAQERDSVASYAEPQVGDYLFEPSPSAMKAQPFKLFCEKFGLKKLQRHTHLFTSTSPRESLPGKWYHIDNRFDMASSKLKEIGRQIGQADVAVRNHPIKPDELAKRLKIKAGGCHRLMCCTVGDGSVSKGLILLLSRYFF
jgi:hypothetical protein